ncbi:MAG TPA: MFS transporter [Gammaproteobacteria bacterium]|nr:MFS transporter [Gammaproteobacteria bacterium]
MSAQNFFRILPLFMVIFVDMLSSSILLPLLPTLFLNTDTSILSIHAIPSMRYFMFGLVQGIASLAMFFGAPILGDLSDRLGRKRILIIALLGTFLSYLLAAFAVLIHSVSLLLFGRVIAGFTGGSLSTAQAAITDISSEKQRTTNIGYILLAVSMGSILGPLLSGTLSNPRWASWFHVTTPLYFAAIISAVNLVYLYFAFRETFVPVEKKQVHPLSGLNVITSAFTMPRLFGLTMAFLFMQLGWATFVQFIALFLTLRYHLSPNEIGIYMACIGVGFTLAFCYLLSVITARFSLRNIALVSISLIGLFILGILFIHHELSAWILAIPAATSLAIGYSVLVSLFSEQVDKNKQGWIMGLTGAISAFSFGVTGLGAGVLAKFGAATPLWVALGCLIISILSLIYMRYHAARELSA